MKSITDTCIASAGWIEVFYFWLLAILQVKDKLKASIERGMQIEELLEVANADVRFSISNFFIFNLHQLAQQYQLYSLTIQYSQAASSVCSLQLH